MPKSKPRRMRADNLLLEQGFCEDIAIAKALIISGKVLATDHQGKERKIEKAGESLPIDIQFRLKGEKQTYVSRAGHKLEGALDYFKIDVSGLICADLGLSTGGFSDCLLQRNAAKIHGVDVAYGIVHWKLRNHPKLILHERLNVKNLTPEILGEACNLIVIDLSFIGLRNILHVVPPLLSPNGQIIALLKPQFELPKQDIPPGGIVTEELRQKALSQTIQLVQDLNLCVEDHVDSVLPGKAGNKEILLLIRKP